MSTTHPILIAGAWADDPSAETFSATNPANGESLEDSYPVSSRETLERMARSSAEAASHLNTLEPHRVSAFLDAHAALIDERRVSIAEMAHRETGLAKSPRLLESEMDRTIDQLRQAAASVRSGEWVSARIDTQKNLRSMYEPLGGGVLTIGPNNFPLAYNAIAGGDFAAAIAARNPVIAKGHPLHPGTTRLLAECAHDAATGTKMPAGTVQLFYHCSPENGLELIRMPEISAFGFTGSQKAGLAMKEAADETGTPAYLELSSINPMFLLPGAVDTKGDNIAKSIAESMLAASGQQCTCPGLIVLRDLDASEAMIAKLKNCLCEAEPQVMLSHDGVESMHDAVRHNIEQGAERLIGGNPMPGDAARYEHTLLRVSGSRFIENHKELQTEMFGVAALVVVCDKDDQLVEIARKLEGNLTGTIHHDGSEQDRSLHDRLVRTLRLRVGRLIHNGVPTGVSVNAATVHGGPYPATGHPGFTAVGIPTSIHRFAALRCYDRVEEWALPQELRNKNPTGTMLRYVDQEWTTRDA